jgi:4-amino-4-deoxy-L-arabinose transferase-like glycosyltransferase
MRQAMRRLPRAAWACALVGVLNAAAWSLITPAFSVPDEGAHFVYAQQLALTGVPPIKSGNVYPPAITTIYTDIKSTVTPLHPENRGIWSRPDQQRLDRDLHAGLSVHGAGESDEASGEPPLYYLLQTVPYRLAPGGTLLDRLAFMRLLSALLAGATALLSFLFVREVLPRTPWAWTVGGLGAAFLPLFGFVSGSVNPDALLYATSAALLCTVARAFRRGLTPALAAWIGAAVSINLVTKLNAIALVPGAALAVLILAHRAHPDSTARAARLVGRAALTAAIPAGLVYLATRTFWRPGGSGGAVSSVSDGAANLANRHETPLEAMSFLWQYYLPRLPGMHAFLPQTGAFTADIEWFKRFVGKYGIVDTLLPTWAYLVAVPIVTAGFGLALRAIVRARTAVRARVGEVATYGTFLAGLMLLVAASSYSIQGHGNYSQTRYFLPLLPFYAVTLALVARGTGRRWGPVAGVAIVAIAIGHDVFSQLVTVARYYG